MTARNPTSAPTDIERRQFGDLAGDIAYLRRACMLVVVPFRGAFRIGVGRADDDVVSSDGIRARAALERARRTVKPNREVEVPRPLGRELDGARRQFAKVRAGRQGRR